jgi:hypothetical protein
MAETLLPAGSCLFQGKACGVQKERERIELLPIGDSVNEVHILSCIAFRVSSRSYLAFASASFIAPAP